MVVKVVVLLGRVFLYVFCLLGFGVRVFDLLVLDFFSIFGMWLFLIFFGELGVLGGDLFCFEFVIYDGFGNINDDMSLFFMTEF